MERTEKHTEMHGEYTQEHVVVVSPGHLRTLNGHSHFHTQTPQERSLRNYPLIRIASIGEHTLPDVVVGTA